MTSLIRFTYFSYIFFNLSNLIISDAQAVSLSDQGAQYEVLFTNPECGEYEYSSQNHVFTNSGVELSSKPKNVFCTMFDSARSASRPESPQYRLKEWIKSPETKEIFFSYLSFSDATIKSALCEAVKNGVKLTFIQDNPVFGITKNEEPLDLTNEQRNSLAEPIQYSEDTGSLYQWLKSMPSSVKRSMTSALSILECGKDNTQNLKPTLYLRGKTFKSFKRGNKYIRSDKIGLAHNKFFIVNPKLNQLKISFSSGNLSSGTVLHHENWNFITLKKESYFAQSHLCLMNSMIQSGFQTRKVFAQSIKNCKEQISYEKEEDITSFFVPGEGQLAMKEIIAQIEASDLIELAVHRFSNRKLREALLKALRDGKKVRMIADDDLYYIGTSYGRTQAHRTPLGLNMKNEWKYVKELLNAGLEVKYMETNHWNSLSRSLRRFFPLLHHNKFIIFSTIDQLTSTYNTRSVFAGAGNFTNNAFHENFENFYLIRHPESIQSFKNQYDHMWTELATHSNDLPEHNEAPKVISENQSMNGYL